MVPFRYLGRDPFRYYATGSTLLGYHRREFYHSRFSPLDTTFRALRDTFYRLLTPVLDYILGTCLNSITPGTTLWILRFTYSRDPFQFRHHDSTLLCLCARFFHSRLLAWIVPTFRCSVRALFVTHEFYPSGALPNSITPQVLRIYYLSGTLRDPFDTSCSSTLLGRAEFFLPVLGAWILPFDFRSDPFSIFIRSSTLLGACQILYHSPVLCFGYYLSRYSPDPFPIALCSSTLLGAPIGFLSLPVARLDTTFPVLTQTIFRCHGFYPSTSLAANSILPVLNA
ncbi:hypothetical protein AAG906_027219 [Vitis piasezkii]